ncbi:serine hydrolase [Skermania sp. ID1734]|uniref:serine hydrolase n=1 Tax=Skermania sp. ID1734 TaxID=2597516 RepID=UPI00117DEE58|nr:serine hydrolase [Skermania sp. ID1734]TSE01984.1 serine hydrolase [Skermania sp. ID1734]
MANCPRRAVRLTAVLILLACAAAGSVSCTTATNDNAETSVAPSSETNLPPGEYSSVTVTDQRIDDAVGKLDGLVNDLMQSSHIPGMAVAVVHGGKTMYAKGFGVRDIARPDKVDPDTVFQLASVSKSVSATVVAHEVGRGAVTWDTPVVSKLPWFTLRDPYVTQNVTVADMFAHRSGLPDHAGDKLEDLGYDRRQVLERLRFQPLGPFRITYDYTNFGLTAGADAVAAAAGTDYASLAAQAIFAPLGMNSTSARFADFQARPDHAVGHMLVDGKYVAQRVRDPDAQAPAGGVSSSVNDMAKWLAMLIANGSFDGKQIVDSKALLPAITPQIVSGPSKTPAARAGLYGYGFNVSTTSGGRQIYSHSGAFALGAATNFVVMPSANLAIIALTNAAPIGLPETLTAEFMDLVQYGQIRQDWKNLYRNAFDAMDKPVGSLVGKQPPANPAPAQPLSSYTGVYQNDYWGPATVTEQGGKLMLALGPQRQTFELSHWDGDTFTFRLNNENAPEGTISKASFAGDSLTLEYYDTEGLGRFTK